MWLAALLLLTGELCAQPATEADAAATPPELSAEAQAAADRLRVEFPVGTEARAMLDAITSGDELSPGSGWFALSRLSTRFDWEYVRATFDDDGNDSIEKSEWSGAASDFTRLDRNGDGTVTAADLDWSAPSLSRTPGSMIFSQSDTDANGKITAEEFATLFAKLDAGELGFLALEDVREKFQPPTTPPSASSEPAPDDPSVDTLVLALRDQEVGSLQPGPGIDDIAPDFTLTGLDGATVTLSREIGAQPVVLIFGNFTCGPFRSQSGNIEKLYERYRDRAKFFLVYVREAHPAESWWMTSNQRVGIEIAQPASDAARREVAATCRAHLDLALPFLVDTVDDRVGASYSGMPNRLYLIDSAGKVAFKTARGPFGFHTRALEQALVLLLNSPAAPAPAKSP